MTRALRVAACGLVLLAMDHSRAQAQVRLGSSAPALGSWEISGGAVGATGYDLGSRSADLTRNTGTGTGPFPLFQTSTEVTPATGAVVRVGLYVSRSIVVEGGAQYLRPSVSTRVTADAEQGGDAVLEDALTRLVVGGSIVFHLNRLSFAGGKGIPFIAGGAGYLRDLHQGNELIETGTEYHAGAGLKYWFGLGRRRLGIRADVEASMRDGAFDFSETRRMVPSASVSIAYLF